MQIGWLSKLDYHGNINVKIHATTTLKCFHINTSEISLSLAVKPSTVVRLLNFKVYEASKAPQSYCKSLTFVHSINISV